MKWKHSEKVEHPPAGELTHGLCVVNTWESMLKQVGINDDAKNMLSAAKDRRTTELETALQQRSDFISRRLDRIKFLVSLDDLDAEADRQVARTATVAVRADGQRIKQLYIDQLTALKTAGILPEDAKLTFETSDLSSAYGMTKRDLLIGARVMFTLNGRAFSHIFHFGFEETPPYYHDLSDKDGSGIQAIMNQAFMEGPVIIDQIMQNPAQLGKTWNTVAFYPGYENVQRMRAR